MEPYFKWLEIKAKDKDEIKAIMEQAFDAAHGNPEWAEKFQELLKTAQLSGENTAWDACFKFLRINQDDQWQDVLSKAREYGRKIYQKAAETKFDAVFVRERWVKCLIRYALHDVGVGKLGLYQGRLQVFAQYDEEGYLVIPKRDFSVDCELRVEFVMQEKGDAWMEADRGLSWVDYICQECEWWC